METLYKTEAGRPASDGAIDVYGAVYIYGAVYFYSVRVSQKGLHLVSVVQLVSVRDARKN